MEGQRYDNKCVAHAKQSRGKRVLEGGHAVCWRQSTFMHKALQEKSATFSSRDAKVTENAGRLPHKCRLLD